MTTARRARQIGVLALLIGLATGCSSDSDGSSAPDGPPAATAGVSAPLAGVELDVRRDPG